MHAQTQLTLNAWTSKASDPKCAVTAVITSVLLFFYSSYGLFSGELGTCFLPPCNCKYLFIRREREACVSVTMNQECSEICTWLFFFCLFLFQMSNISPRDLISLFLRRANGSTSFPPSLPRGQVLPVWLKEPFANVCVWDVRCCHGNTKLLWHLFAAPSRRAPAVFCSGWHRGGGRPRETRYVIPTYSVGPKSGTNVGVGVPTPALPALAVSCGFDCLDRRLALFVGKPARLPTTNKKRLWNWLYAGNPTNGSRRRLASFN